MSNQEVGIELTTANPLKFPDVETESVGIKKHDPEIVHRQDAMHLARGMAILLMMIHHVIIYFADYDLWDSPVLLWTQKGPGSVAVMFMFIMGINAADPERNNAKTLARRGAKLFVFAYVLNFVRDQVPLMLSCQFRDLCYDDVYLEGYWDMFFILDIYPFVGACFLYIAMMRSFSVSEVGQLTLTTIIVMILSLIETDSDPTGIFGYFFLGDFYLCYFPFRSWIIFPVVGLLLGSYWRPYGDRTKDSVPMKKLLIGAVIIWVCLFIAMFVFWPNLDHYGFDDEFNYYRQHPLINIFFICQNILVLEGFRFLFSKNAIPKVVFKLFKFWSQNIMPIYIISWMIITWYASLVIGWYSVTNLYFVVGYSVVVVTLSSLIIHYVPGIGNFLKKMLK
ncbi:hypothetical protein GEMRC1_012065 [Eukaryota sp. GEM-RC1]